MKEFGATNGRPDAYLVSLVARKSSTIYVCQQCGATSPGFLEEAYRRTRKDGAVGEDGVTAEAYEERLLENLSELLERFKSGRYRAPPVRRVHIPKAGTAKMRPIGIPTLEDKILQRAVLMVLEPVYEQDFLDYSYGFRPGRGAHQAVQVL